MKGHFRNPVFDSAMRFCVTLLLILVVTPAARSGNSNDNELHRWSLEEALEILNNSPWARQQTVVRVVPGIGSGVVGEKEIFGRYFVRLLSAKPVRQAYARAEQILSASDGLDDEQKRRLGNVRLEQLNLDLARYIVLAVSFRSNDSILERTVESALQAQTTETLRTRAYLSTSVFPQLEIVAFYPAVEDAVGVKFVFPKQIDSTPVVSTQDESITFELDLPGRVPDLRISFPVSEEMELFDRYREELSSRQIDKSLEQIEDYQVQVGEFGEVVNPRSESLEELVNVFPPVRGGTFRGSVYEFHRNDNLDARNFFDPVGEPLPEFKRNQFGAELGLALGPRLNLFGYYDGLRINQGSTILSHVPTQAMKRGDFSELLDDELQVQLVDPDTGAYFPGNRIPEERIHSVSHLLFPLLPDPNRSDASRNFVNNQPLLEDRDETLARVDFELDPRNKLSTFYRLVQNTELSNHPLPSFGSQYNRTGQVASFSYTRTFSSNLVGRGVMDLYRTSRLEISRHPRPLGLLNSLGIQGVSAEEEGYPVFELVGYSSFGDEDLPRGRVFNGYWFAPELTYVRGNHTLKLSGEAGFRQINNDRSPGPERGVFRFSGAFTGDGFADFLMGRADLANRAIGSSRLDLRNKFFKLHLSDTWKLNSQFTLSLGITYNYFSPFRSIGDNISVFYPLLFEPPLDGELVKVGSPLAEELGLDRAGNGMLFPDYNDWAPRIGLAYRPFTNDSIVVRASYVVQYDPMDSWIYRRFLGRNFPSYYFENAYAAVDSPGLDLSIPFATDTAAELNIRGISPTSRTSYDQSWRFRVQNRVTDDWQLEVRYNGTKGTHENRIVPGNVPSPGPGAIQPRRPNATYGSFLIVNDGGSSSFHELEFSGERHLTHGYALKFRSEWRRYFDDNFRGEPSDPRNLRAEWAPGRGVPELRFAVDYLVDLPFGRGRLIESSAEWMEWLVGNWKVAGVTRIESGTYFSVLLPGDPNNDGVSADRPQRLGSGNSPPDRSIDQWFDTRVFTTPETFDFGNAGRNILQSPGFSNWDMSLVKGAAFTNGHQLQLRFSFFNVFNHPNFEQPDRTLGTPLFGKIFAAERAREIEVALKYSF